MKVLIADKFEQSGIDGLQAAGCDVQYDPDLKDEGLVGALRASGAQVLVVRSTPVTEPMLDAGQLSLIVRAGAGVNTIDVAAASRRGIYVSNCPGKNAVAVAELTFALILALDRRVADNVSDLRRGKWNKKEFSKARGLFGRTLGLLGFGNIGQEVASRARAFGMPVTVWSRRFTGNAELRALAAEQGGIQVMESAGQVAGCADVISIHLALSKDTRGFVNAGVLEQIQPGAMLINTARAEVLDYAALADAVRTKGLRVGLDVFANEPAAAEGPFEDPLLALPNVIGTHHIGASTVQAQEAIAAETVRVVKAFAETGRVPNVVNLAKRTPATHMLVVRHRDRPGVLAHVFEQLRQAHLNVQETENIIFEGAEAAVARINLDGAPPEVTKAAIQSGHDDVLDLQIVKL
ncbi:MAG TPA: NAD(P)-dependent oxidoreductase [Vicinamibacterales bacterium]|nr:NAD(P)-dependent oxidoreductase [Vicinamibacterales bacterium]